MRVVPYFDLFFIPLFPVGSGSRVLRCSHCRLEVPTTGVFTKAWDAEEVAPESVSVEEAPESRDWGFSGPGGGRRASTEEQIYCIHCGRRFRVRAHDGLQRVHCPVCERDFEIGL
ncbi:MAG: hypothetical protein KC729_03870 [Candidatus Eisenbacteria bacterium]|uniref:Uncharacterized protein n=1 Tax=Eiseniibacteriota bacterium TaxID=2212470 RepID=A0A956LWV2_UNCEI|nr:hypothetical protein [Candidatus Eisenbacteria bacterium]